MKKIIFITFFCMLFSQNTSFDFTNGTYGRIPLTESLSNFNEFTVEFWYYQIGSGEEFIVATEYFNTGWGFHNENPNVLQLRIENGPYSLGGNNFSIPYNEWVHIAGVYDGSTLYLFVNGNLIASESYSGPISDSRNEDIVINRHVWASGSSSRLSGQLDELRISNIARYTSNFNPPNYEFENDNNTMGLWHFNNDFNDYSGNGNHGIHNGTGYSNNTPSFTTIQTIPGCTDELACNYNPDADTNDGNCDYSCNDDGDYSLNFENNIDYIDLNSLSFYESEGVTFTFDIKNDWSTGHENIFDFGGTPLCSYHTRYMINQDNGLIVAGMEGRLLDENGGPSGGESQVSYSLAEYNEEWIHIAVTFGVSGSKIYLNSELVANTDYSYEGLFDLFEYLPEGVPCSDGNAANIKRIGGNSDNPGNYQFDGFIDNFTLWNKELASSEINNIYNDVELNGNEENLVGYWKFNAGEGDILYDHSGNFNHGIIYSANWINNDITPNAYNVPEEFSSIQEAINYSTDEDTIYVASGTYYENINIDNKNIFLIGENSENTIIDGSNNGRVVNILNSSDSLSIQNFSIINGERYGNGADGYGGGIFIQNSNVNFDNINVSNCTVSDKGAGVWIASNSNVLLENSKVYNNNIYSSSQFGGGIGSSEANLIIKNSLISNNYSDDAGGLYHSNGLLEIYNSTITYNGGHEHNHNYSAGLLTINSYGLITNTIIYDNDNSIPSIYMESSDIDISFSNIEDYFGGENNINTDPLFLDPSNYNYTLSPDSPCIDMGNPNSPLDPDGTIADIGAYYYDQTFEDNNPNIHFVPQEFSSIQSAIDNSTHGDTILVSLGIYYENINFNGKNVSLIGEDRSTTIIDGDENGPVISFINSENNDALLKSFTIRNGSGQTMGAGIRVYQASPTLDDLIVENNSGSNHGGGIALEYGSAIVKNSIIRNNSTITGGGIYCNGNPTLDHLEITGNYASGDGGGITLSNCSPTMTHITVADNSAPIGSGIQLAWDGTNASITNSIVRGDIDTYGDPSLNATYSNIENGWNGNGVFDADPLFFDPSDGNYSLQSDSPCIDSADPNSSLDPDGTIADIGAYYYDQTFEDNNPNIHFVPDQFSSIQAAIDNSIDGDTILVTAGTYYENINFNGKNISLIGEDRNTTIIDGGSDGSVIHFENGISETTQIKSFTIQNGHAEDGGGIYCINSSPKLIDIILKNNIADDDGAAIWMENSNPLIESLIIYDNSANDHAGGIMILGNSNPNLISTTIYNNISNNEGSGITIHNSLATINNCEIYNNNAGMGGGIYIANHEFQANEVVITNSDIQGNSATHGGGIYANGGKLNIVDSNIKGNNAGYAGGLWVNNINLSINMSKFTENVSQECSGAIYSSNSQILMSKVEITDNMANDNCHSAVYLDNNTQANLNKLTVANNGSSESEQDFGVYDSNVNIFNSIILEDFLDISSNLIITYSNVAYEDEVWVGIGNIAQEPYFTDPENGDYTLQIISPCIDAGDPDSDFDEDGTIADMGAYSFNQTENPIIYGCTNSSAENYSQEANIEDGSCFCSEGYTDIDYECLLTGDVNQDAYIDIVDVITIIQITLDIYEYSGVEFILADFNSDDSVDISDIVAIINYILEN